MIWIIILSWSGVSVCNGYTYPPKMTTELMLEIRQNIIGKIYNMSSDIMKDVEIKYRLVQRYIDMHKGTWDFEVGLIAGSLFDHFRNMLRIYKQHSNMSLMQYYDEAGYYVFDRANHYNYLYIFQLVHGEYNEIVYNKRAFFTLYDKHLELKKKYRGSNVVMPVRRRYPLKTTPAMSTTPGDYYVDYFGHKVYKNEVKKSNPLDAEESDHFEDYFEQHVEELITKYTNKSGIEIPRNGELKKTYDFISNTDVENVERNMELHMGKKERMKSQKIIEEMEKINRKGKIGGNNEHTILRMGEEQRLEQQNVKERVSYKKDIDDSEYKKMLRLKSYEKQRANFNPELEGIEINLKDMV